MSSAVLSFAKCAPIPVPDHVRKAASPKTVYLLPASPPAQGGRRGGDQAAGVGGPSVQHRPAGSAYLPEWFLFMLCPCPRPRVLSLCRFNGSTIEFSSYGTMVFGAIVPQVVGASGKRCKITEIAIASGDKHATFASAARNRSSGSHRCAPR